MTKEEFEFGYAERSGISIETLHRLGLYGIPCDCKEEGCKGWQMVGNRQELGDVIYRGVLRISQGRNYDSSL